jgi:hypothetical protein
MGIGRSCFQIILLTAAQQQSQQHDSDQVLSTARHIINLCTIYTQSLARKASIQTEHNLSYRYNITT